MESNNEQLSQIEFAMMGMCAMNALGAIVPIPTDRLEAFVNHVNSPDFKSKFESEQNTKATKIQELNWRANARAFGLLLEFRQKLDRQMKLDEQAQLEELNKLI